MARICPTCGWETSTTEAAECPVCGADMPPAVDETGTGESPPHGGGVGQERPSTELAGGPPATGADGQLPETVRNWAMASHLSAFVLFLGVPVSVVGPLVIWLIKREAHPFIDEHAKEAVNFNLSVLIYVIVSLIAMLALVGFVLFPIVAIFWFVVTIIAAVRAANGESYRYPLTIRFVS